MTKSTDRTTINLVASDVVTIQIALQAYAMELQNKGLEASANSYIKLTQQLETYIPDYHVAKRG